MKSCRKLVEKKRKMNTIERENKIYDWELEHFHGSKPKSP